MLRFCFNSSVMLLLSFTMDAPKISCHKCTCLSILKHSIETLTQPSTLDLSVSGEGGSFMTSPPAAAAASGSQILDLTRSDSGYGSSSPRTSTTSAPSSSAAAKKSKVEQTEPVDFSSGQQAQQLSFASRSTGTFDDLSRYRSPGRQFNSIAIHLGDSEPFLVPGSIAFDAVYTDRHAYQFHSWEIFWDSSVELFYFHAVPYKPY